MILMLHKMENESEEISLMSEKNAIDIIINGTTEYRKKIVDLLIKHEKTINCSEDYRLLSNFVILFIGYQEEIMILQNKKKYISALPLTRISLECYSTIKVLISLHNGNPILPYDKQLTMQLLAYHDICEEIELFLSLKKPERKKEIGNEYKEMIISDILSAFDISYISKNTSGEISLCKTKENLRKRFEEQFSKNKIPSNAVIVKEALRNNRLMTNENGDTFNEAQYIYTELSKTCHNTVCSMKERIEVEFNGVIYSSLGKEHKNNLPYMQINFNCLCDVFTELKELLNSSI